MTNTIGIYYCITCSLPAIDPNTGQAVIINGEPVYETNYFCRVLTDPKTGARFYEWDTDNRYAQRFLNSTGAENFHRVVLNNLDGCRIDLHPGNIKKFSKPKKQ